MSIPLLLLSAGEYHYVPFVKPMPIWDYWYVLLLPLCLIIAVVYKSIRCYTMDRVPREALTLFVFILAVMLAAGAALAGLVNILEM